VFGDDPFITRQFAQIHDSSMLGPTAPDTLFTKSARIARYTLTGKELDGCFFKIYRPGYP
jgi:hypothetical protein